MATIENYDDERFITLLVRDRGQVEEKRSDKPDSELKKTESVDNPAKAFNSLPKQAASQEDGFGEHIEISTAFAIAEPCVGARALLRCCRHLRLSFVVSQWNHA